MTSRAHPLPTVIAEIAEIAGMDAAWAIARAKGGRQVYVPSEAKPDHWLTELVGLAAAQKICDFYRAGNSGAHLLIPMGSSLRTKAEIAKAIETGGSNGQIAGEFGKHERTIRRHRAQLGAPSSTDILKKRQGDLF